MEGIIVLFTTVRLAMGCGVICSMVMEEKHSRLICCDCIITCVPWLGVTRRLGTISKCRAFATSRWHSILEIPVCRPARSGCKAWRIVRTCSLFPAFCTIMVMLFYRLLARSRRLRGKARWDELRLVNRFPMNGCLVTNTLIPSWPSSLQTSLSSPQGR